MCKYFGFSINFKLNLMIFRSHFLPLFHFIIANLWKFMALVFLIMDLKWINKNIFFFQSGIILYVLDISPSLGPLIIIFFLRITAFNLQRYFAIFSGLKITPTHFQTSYVRAYFISSVRATLQRLKDYCIVYY